MNVYELHQDVFGVSPIIIGINWEDLPDRILSAIEDGVPYDETREIERDLLAGLNDGQVYF
jgi:DNA repair photolyase